MGKNNRSTKQRIIASLLAITMLPVAVSGCSHKNQKEKVSPSSEIVQITQDNIWLLLSSYIDLLKNLKDVEEIAAGLHMPVNLLENKEVLSELLEIVLENKDYASTVNFVPCSENSEFYYTSDGRLSFVVESQELYIKKNKDNDWIVKSIKVDENAETNTIWEDTYFSDDGSQLQSDISINNWGSIGPEIAPGIFYSIGNFYKNDESKHYFFYHGDNCLSFSSNDNLIKISSGYRDFCTMKISDEEKQEIISVYNDHNHEGLMALEKQMAEKYKNNYVQEKISCAMSFQESDRGVAVFISKDEENKDLSAYVYSLSGDSYDNFEKRLTVHSDITDAQYTILKDYMERNDENIVAYVEQISSEQKAANAIKESGGSSTKVYTKK